MERELTEAGYDSGNVDRYLALFKEMNASGDTLAFIEEKMTGFLDEAVKAGFREIIESVNATKGDCFKLVFDPTLVRGMSYYTGTIFEIAMPELGASCGGGGRYDKMVGRFTGKDVPACGFSIGFERIILILMESGFKVPNQSKKGGISDREGRVGRGIVRYYRGGAEGETERCTGACGAHEQEQKIPEGAADGGGLRRIQAVL